MLTSRAQHLLKTLVECYIADGQPVGSRTLSQRSGLDLSAASIRNVMADLESHGFIISPHTSAGRVPTPLGYRYFVDTLLTVAPFTAATLPAGLAQQFSPDNPERMAATASHLLSDLTQFAGLVRLPRRQTLAIRHIEFLSMAAHRVLLILVATDGSVQNRLLQTERDYTTSELIEAANFLNEHYAGCTFAGMRGRLQTELQRLTQDMSALMTAAVTAGEEVLASEDKLVLSGEGNLLNVRDLTSNVDQLRRLFTIFEQKTALLLLLDVSQRADGVQIFIGGDSGLLPLDDCTVVTAPFAVEGQVVGTLGVIGPTRMAYDRVIPIVDVTARLMGNALSA